MPRESVQVALLRATTSAKQMSKAVRIWGDNELRRMLTKASRDSARGAVPYVQAYVPVDTGTLRKNIKPAGSKTIPKLKAGTKTRGGPYAWLVHSGHALRDGSRYPGVPYMRLGLADAYPKIIDKYLDGMAEAARLFNKKLKARPIPGIGKVRL